MLIRQGFYFYNPMKTSNFLYDTYCCNKVPNKTNVVIDKAKIEIDKFRFCIVDEKNRKRSSTWHITAQGSSVYMYVNSLGNRMKLSLHPKDGSEDGKDSQYGFTRNYRGRLNDLSFEQPELLRWVRPKPQGNNVVQVVKVYFPTDFLQGKVVDERANYKRKPGSNRKWRFSFPMASENMAVEISIYYSLVASEPLEQLIIRKGYTPMFSINLPNGQFVSIAGREVKFAPDVIPAFSKSSPKPLDGFDSIEGTTKDLHAILFNQPSDNGILELVEVNGLMLVKNK